VVEHCEEVKFESYINVGVQQLYALNTEEQVLGRRRRVGYIYVGVCKSLIVVFNE